MKAVLLLLGLCLGLWGVFYIDVPTSIAVFLFAIPCFLLAKKKKVLRFFCGGLAAGAAVGLLGYIPYPSVDRIEGFVVFASKNYVIVLSGFRRYYVSIQGHSYELFDLLEIKGKTSALRFTTYESRFDFALYLNKLGARQEFVLDSVNEKLLMPLRIQKAEDTFLAKFSEDTSALLSSILFFRRDYGSEPILHAQSLGLLYLFSSSGLILSSFFRFIEGLFISLAGKRKIIIVTLALAFSFVILSRGKIGPLRVFVSTAVRLIYVNKKDKPPSCARRSYGAFALLAIDFHLVYQEGFLLGFGIGFMLDGARAICLTYEKSYRKAVSLGFIRAFLLPFQIVREDGLAILSLPYALFLAPIAIFFSSLGYLSFFLFPMPGLLNPLGSGISAILYALDGFNPLIPLPRIGPIYLVVFLILFFAFIFIREAGDRREAYLLPLSYVGLFVISLVPVIPCISQEVTFINVGQGDCILIRDHLTSVMIDTGGVVGMDIAKESLLPYLRKKRIYKIDCLIASHHDYDHIGGVDSLKANYKVLRYVDSFEDFPLTVGRLTFFNHNQNGGGEENDRSLFLSLSFMGESFLFTGDASSAIEKQVIKDDPSLRCGILKVGHHGSKSSTCEEFLDAVKPHTAVISCAAKNKYGHPEKTVLKRLTSRGIKVRRTDEEGTITYSKLSLS